MNRRGFLQCLGAVSTAIAAGVRFPVPTAAAPPSQQQKDLVATVLEMLQHCRPISYERSDSVMMFTTHRVEYLYDPKNEYRGADLSDVVGDFPQTMRPVSVVATTQSDDVIDARFLGEDVGAVRQTIEVVWA